MCHLHDRLCVSERVWPEQVIWSFYSEEQGIERIFYSITLKTTLYWLSNCIMAFAPLSVLQNDTISQSSILGWFAVAASDIKTKSCDIAYESKVKSYGALCYFRV
ncbi:unnamed protein product [Brassica oleracea]